MQPVLSVFAKVVFLIAVVVGTAHSQTSDYYLSQAMRSVNSLSSSLQRLQPNDQSGIKRLSKKLDKAAQMLETSESKSHPDYDITVKQVAELQQQLQQMVAGQPEEPATSNAEAASPPANQPVPAVSNDQTSTPAQSTTAKPAQSQVMDYNLSQAIREVDSITNGLSRLREDDINGFNRLSNKLNKAADLLQGSASTGHPEFTSTAQRWTELQQQMVPIAAALREAQAQQQKLLAEQKAKQEAEAKQKREAKAVETARLEEQRKLHAQTIAAVLKPMGAKYDRQSLPALPESPTPDQAEEWATVMHALQTSELQADVATIDSLVAEGKANEEDARQTKQWIADSAQYTIRDNISNAKMLAEGAVVGTKTFAEMINAVEPDDMNGAYRFAREDRYENNKKSLEDAIQAGQVVMVFNDIFGPSDRDLTEAVKQIKAAQRKLVELKPAADEQAVVLANAEPAVRPKNKDFIAPIAQEFWFEGNMIAESDTDGSIWIDSNQAGYITHNGEIWIESNDMGSIEPDGEVWFEGNKVGSLEPNGEVWRGGTQVGLIDKEGTAWINGNPTGTIEPFQGEWRRAAIIYYFSDFYR